MKTLLLKYGFAMILLLVSCTPVFAQINDTNELDPVFTTGRILPTKLSQSVQQVRIITARTIENQGSVNLKDVLSKELNIRLGNDNILGSSMSLQGVSGQNVKILLDGVPLVGRENGNIDLNQINLSNIARIEIVEGPVSVVYGTDALGGVINLISKTNKPDKSVQGRLFGYTETIGNYNFGGGIGFHVKPVDINANLNRNFFAGYSPDGGRVMLWKPKLQYYGNYTMATDVGKLRWKFQSDIFNEKIENRGAPTVNSVEAYAFDEYYTTNRTINTLSVDGKISNKYAINVVNSYASYQRDKNTYRKDLVTTEMKPVENAEANSSNFFQSFMSRGMISSLFKGPLNYLAGYDVNHNTARGTRIESASGFLNDFAVFGSLEYRPFKTLSLSPGLRVAYNSRYPAPFVPSFQAKYTINKRFTAKYAYGRGFRAPSLKELYLNFVDYNHDIHGNPDLKSEVSNNHNAILSYKRVTRLYTLTVDNSYFYNHIYRMISLVSINPQTITYTYENIDNYKSIGTNLNATLTSGMFSATVGGSYMGIYNNAFQYVGKHRYTYSPEYRSNISYRLKKEDITFSLFFKHNGKMTGYMLDDARKVVPTVVQPYDILDVTVCKRVRKQGLTVTGGVKNLLNVRTVGNIGSSNNVHGTGNTQMPVSVGRSFFIQANYYF